MTSRDTPTIAITVGDYNGIGPEVALKSIVRSDVQRICTPVLVGPEDVFRYYWRKSKMAGEFQPVNRSSVVNLPGRERPNKRGSILLEPLAMPSGRISPGTLSRTAGLAALDALTLAVRLACNGTVDALVTAPLSKVAIHKAGCRFPGQTEILQHLSSSAKVGMILQSPLMRVGLATIHLPIRRVAREITAKLLHTKVETFRHALMQDWGIRNPKIAILGLNPHAGEQGEIGSEDERIVTPTVRRMLSKGWHVAGPFPADGFFGSGAYHAYDLIVAMYHDQGLIPLKMQSFRTGVNVTVGLPIVRTSPDHGTAFDIAGKGVADAQSMTEAIKRAVEIVHNRRRSRGLNRRKPR